MRTRCIALAFIGLAAVVVPMAGPAEGAAPRTPGRPSTPAEAVRRCTIGSFEGVLIPGTQVCTRISGFVRAETRFGARGRTRH